VYVDTQILTYSVEKHPDVGPLLRPLWEAAHTGTLDAISSELALLEVLVAPLKHGDTALANDYERLFRQPGMRLLPLTRVVLREATHLRASIPRLRTPDALHAATARLSGCALFLTNDPAFRPVPDLPLAVLTDVQRA